MVTARGSFDRATKFWASLSARPALVDDTDPVVIPSLESAIDVEMLDSLDADAPFSVVGLVWVDLVFRRFRSSIAWFLSFLTRAFLGVFSGVYVAALVFSALLVYSSERLLNKSESAPICKYTKLFHVRYAVRIGTLLTSDEGHDGVVSWRHANLLGVK